MATTIQMSNFLFCFGTAVVMSRTESNLYVMYDVFIHSNCLLRTSLYQALTSKLAHNFWFAAFYDFRFLISSNFHLYLLFHGWTCIDFSFFSLFFFSSVSWSAGSPFTPWLPINSNDKYFQLNRRMSSVFIWMIRNMSLRYSASLRRAIGCFHICYF